MATLVEMTVGDNQIMTATWGALSDDEEGDPALTGQWPDRTMQVLGDFGTDAVVTLQGSNDGGTTWFPLKDFEGTLISFAAAGGVLIAENPAMVRPVVTDGTDSDLTVIIKGVR